MHPALIVTMIVGAAAAVLAIAFVRFLRRVNVLELEAGTEILAELAHGPGTCLELAMRASKRGRKIHHGVMHPAARALCRQGAITCHIERGGPERDYRERFVYRLRRVPLPVPGALDHAPTLGGPAIALDSRSPIKMEPSERARLRLLESIDMSIARAEADIQRSREHRGR